jgi:hypothetical protein
VIAIATVDVTDDEEAPFRYRELKLGTGFRNDYGIVGNCAKVLQTCDITLHPEMEDDALRRAAAPLTRNQQARAAQAKQNSCKPRHFSPPVPGI